MKDPYQQLGLDKTPTLDEIEEAYKSAKSNLDEQSQALDLQKKDLQDSYQYLLGVHYPEISQEKIINDPKDLASRPDVLSPEGEAMPSWARPWPVILQVILALFAGALASLVYIFALGLDLESPASGEMFIPQLFTGLAFLLIPFWYIHKRSDSWKQVFSDLGFRSFAPLRSLGWALLAFAVYLTFAGIYSSAFGEAEQDLGLESLGSPLAQFFLIVILAPVAEEICFRGMLFKGLLGRLSLPLAVILQSAIFAVLHVSTGPAAVPILFVLGALFAILYYKTKSLWVPILAHAANNGLVFVAISASA